MGLFWAGTAHAFGLGDIFRYIGVSNNTETVVIEQSSIPIVKPKYNLDKILPTTKVIILPQDYEPRTAGQCVGFVKYITGVEYSGNANVWTQYINSDTPEIGYIVVIQAGRWGHVGFVTEIKDDKITIRSRNWRGLWIISDDEFETNDIRILGYIKV